MTCPYCEHAAKFHSYQPRRLLTVHGELKVQRAYYCCGPCKQSFLPYDDALGLVDEISPGLMPLMCLAGTLLPFADAAEDVLKRFAGVRVSASTVLRCTEGEGERLRAQQKDGRMVKPTQAEPKWIAAREAGQPAAYVGLDAFSVPMQGVGATGASAETHEELRKLIGYFENNRHRTDYRTYRNNGWDIGSGPTEAGCKIIGERLKGSGMRWVSDGAATVAALRALYVSGGKLWDGFWSQPHRQAA